MQIKIAGCVLRRARACAVATGLVCGGTGAAMAGGGGENMLLVVNPNDPAALQIANAYAALRAIPSNNILFIAPPAGYANNGWPVSQADVTNIYLTPIANAISARGLTNQIDYIGTIGQAVEYPVSGVSSTSNVSLNYALTLLTPLTNGSGLTLNNSPLVYGSTGLYQNPGSLPIGSNPAIHHSATYTSNFPYAGKSYTTQYYLSGTIGYTGTNGNTVAEVIASLKSAAAADGSCPVGAIYFEDNGDIRATTRHGQWPTTESQLSARGISWVYENNTPGATPQNRNNVLGAVCGQAVMTLPNGSTYLPGSWADNLTSYGCTFYDTGQTKSTKFIAAGAAGTTGSVAEPYAISQRFTNSSIYTFIVDGSTLGEAFAKSVAAPDIQMPLGDLLAQPFADVPKVSLTSGPANYGHASGIISISAAAALVNPRIATGISTLELLVDGKVSGTLAGGTGTFSLNTASLADGVHEIRIVAINNSQAASEGYVIQQIVVNNHGRAVNFNGGNLTLTTLPAAISVAAVAGDGTVSHVELTCLGRVVAQAAGSTGCLSLSPNALAPGDNVIVPVAVFSDGMRVAGRAFVVHVESGGVNEWSNGTGNGLWSNPLNWTAGALPQSADGVARFSGAASGGTVTLDSSASIEEITLDHSGTGYTIAALPGQTLTLSNSNGATGECLINVLSGSHTISAPLILATGGNLFAVTNPADSLAVSGDVSGSGDLTKTGYGWLNLSGNNTYSGGTFVTAGTLAITGASALPAAGSLTVEPGGSLSMADGTTRSTPVAGLTLAGTATVILDWNGSSADQITTTATASTRGKVAISLNPANTPSGGPLTLIQAAGGLDNALYYLANNANYSATLTVNSTAVQVGSYTSQPALTSAFWYGGLVPGAGNAMALSAADGSTSNWSSTADSLTAVPVVPGATTDVFFSATGATQQSNIVLSANTSVNSLTFNDTIPVTITSDGFVIAVNSTGSGAASAVSANQNAAINAGLDLSGDAVFTTAPGKTLNVGGPITGAGSLTLADSGTVVIYGANSFSGDLTISNSSTLKLGSSEVIPSGPGKGNVILNGALDLNGNSETVNRLAGGGRVDNSNGSGTYTLTVGANAATSTFSGSITNTSGSIGLTKTGAGTLTLSGTNTYRGPTQVLGGTLAIGSASAVPFGAAVTVNGAVLDGGAVSAEIASLTLQNGTVTSNGGILSVGYFQVENGTVSATLGGPGQLVKATAGTVVLSGSNAYSGGTVLYSGLLVVSDDASLGAPSGTLTLDGNGTLKILTNQFHAFSRTLQVSGGGGTLWIDDPANTLVLSGQNLLGTGQLGKDGPGTLQLAGTVASTSIAVRGGMLLLSGTTSQFTGNPLVSLSNGAVWDLNNHDETVGSLNLTGGSIRCGTGALTLNGSVNFLASALPTPIIGNLALGNSGGTFQVDSNAPAVTITQSLSGAPASGLVKTGAGNLILSGTNSYSGPTQILGGTLTMGSTSAIPAASQITVNGGTLNLGTFNSTVASLVLQNGTVTGNNSNLTAGSFNLQNGTISTSLAGLGALSKTTTGTVVLTGSNTYWGGTLISSGTLQIGTGGDTGTLGSGAAPIVDNGTLVINRSGIISITSPISGSGSVTLAGQGTILLSGNNTYAGTTTISAGIWKLGTASAIPGGLGKGDVAVNGTLDLNGQSPTINALSGSGAVDNWSGTETSTLAVGSNNATSTFAGSIRNASGIVALTKTGAGTLTLSGSNIYGGATIVSGGTLLISGANALPGTSVVTVQPGGNLSVADGATRTTPVAGLTLAGPATVTLDWNGSNTDQIATNATATTSGKVGISLNPANTPSGGPFTLIQATGGLDSATYYLANNTNYSATLIVGPTAVQVGSYASQSLLTNYYWAGGRVPGAGNAMALSNGLTSNWTGSSGTAVRLTVPGPTAAVTFSAVSGATQQSDIVLGTNMSVSRLVFNDSNSVTITNDGCAITLNSTSTSAIIANQNATINAGVILGSASTFAFTTASGKTLTIGGPIGGAGALTLAGSGTIILGGNNGYTGATTLAGGTLSVASIGYGNNPGNLGAAGNAASNLVFAGGVLQYTGTGETTDRGFTINATQVAAFNINNPATNLTLTGNSGVTTGGLAMTGPGQLTLAGSYGCAGATTVSGGTLSIGNGGSGASLATSGVALSNNANITFNHSDTAIFNKAITGTGSLAKTGGGTLSLTTPQNYSGATSISGGILKLGTSGPPVTGALVSLDASNASTLNGGTISNGVAVTTWASQGSYTGNLAGCGTGGGPTYVTNAMNGKPVLRFNGSDQYMEGTNVLTAGSFASNSATMFVVFSSNNDNAYVLAGVRNNDEWWRWDGNGQTYISTFRSTRLENVNAGMPTAPGAHVFTVESDNTANAYNLWLDGVNKYAGAASWQIDTTLDLGRCLQGNSVKNLNGDIAELLIYPTALNATDRAAVESYLNNKWVTGGGSGGSATNLLPVGSPLAIRATAALDLNGVNQTVGGLSGPAGAVIGNSGKTAATLTFDPGSASTTFGGTIRDGMPGGDIGQVALNVLSGTLTLAGANTYTGPTTVNTGTLALSGALTNNIASSGSINLGAGATLDAGGLTGGTLVLSQPLKVWGAGTATVTGALTATGHTLDLQDGTNLGNLTINGGLLTLANCTLRFDLGGSHADVINAAGGVACSGIQTISLAALTGTTGLATGAKAYTLITGTGLTGAGFSVPSALAVGGTTYHLFPDADGTGLYLDVSAGPTKLAIIAVNGGSEPAAGTGFNVIVQALDVLGAPQNVTTNTTVTLGLATGSGTLGGTLAGTITAGTSAVSISGVTYTKAESGVVLTATGGLLAGAASAPFTVIPAAGASVAVSGFPNLQTAGTPGSVTVTVRDAFGNLASGFTGTVHFTSSDGAALLPGDSALAGGSGTFSVTLATPGTQSITATVSGSITGTQSGIMVRSIYQVWAAACGLTGETGSSTDPAFDADPDKDGVANGLVWILGGTDPLANNRWLLPAATGDSDGLHLRFNRLQASVGQAALVVQWSTDPGGPWNDVTVGADNSGPDGNGVMVTVTPASPADAVTVDIPATNALSNMLFARLRASQP